MERGFSPMKYFNYYRTHTENVVLVWKDIRDVLYEEKIINDEEYDKITRLVIWHDNSKISKEEFDGYGLKFFGDSENQETAEKFKAAWKHHKENNLHHHQSLKSYQGKDKKCYIIEMLCDWIAMGWEMETLAIDYYNQIKDTIEFSDEEKLFIESIFAIIEKHNCYSSRKITSKEKIKIMFF